MSYQTAVVSNRLREVAPTHMSVIENREDRLDRLVGIIKNQSQYKAVMGIMSDDEIPLLMQEIWKSWGPIYDKADGKILPAPSVTTILPLTPEQYIQAYTPWFFTQPESERKLRKLDNGVNNFATRMGEFVNMPVREVWAIRGYFYSIAVPEVDVFASYRSDTDLWTSRYQRSHNPEFGHNKAGFFILKTPNAASVGRSLTVEVGYNSGIVPDISINIAEKAWIRWGPFQREDKEFVPIQADSVYHHIHTAHEAKDRLALALSKRGMGPTVVYAHR